MKAYTPSSIGVHNSHTQHFF